MKTPKSAPSTAASQSASGKKMLGDLPPSSRVTRLSVSAALFTMIFPTAALPVKAILSTLGCATMGTGGFAETVDDVDHAGRQAGFFEPIGEFQRREGSLLGRLEHAGAACSDSGSQLPGGHEQRIVPGNDLSRDAHGFAHRETQRVSGNGIHLAGDFVGEAAVILEAGGDVGDVEFRFDDGLAGVAALEFGELRGVLADLFSKLEKDAPAILGR